MKNYNIKSILNLPKQLIKVRVNPYSHNGLNGLLVTADCKRYAKYYCPKCNKYHKHLSKGFFTSNIKYDVSSHGLIILSVRKRRFTCVACNKTFTPTIDNISFKKSISDIIDKRIRTSIDKSTTAKYVAYNYFVSHSYASRVFSEVIMSNHYKMNFNELPISIGFDEFKSVKDKMSFIMVNHSNDKVIDIVETRNSLKLDQYFKQFSLEARNNVETITMDMYDPYIKLVKKHFKNATIIFDKFHIIANLTKALNKTIIEIMNTYPVSSIEYKRLKKNWKLLLRLNNDHWSDTRYKISGFDNKLSLSDAVEEIIKIHPSLKGGYDFLTVFHLYLNKKDFTSAQDIIDLHIETLHPKLLPAVKTYIKYKDYCNNAYITNLSNARVESKIQKIKLIKRATFGIPKFISLRNRILYLQEIEEIKKATNKAIYPTKFVAELLNN